MKKNFVLISLFLVFLTCQVCLGKTMDSGQTDPQVNLRIVQTERIAEKDTDPRKVFAALNGFDLLIRVRLENRGQSEILVPVLWHSSGGMTLQPLGFRLRKNPQRKVFWNHILIRCAEAESSPGIPAFLGPRKEIKWIRFSPGSVVEWVDFQTSRDPEWLIGVSVLLKNDMNSEPIELFSQFELPPASKSPKTPFCKSPADAT